MDDNEYYAMMRRQYSHPVQIKKTNAAGSTNAAPAEKPAPAQNTVKSSFSSWNAHHGREDAEMLNETSSDDVE